MGPKNAKNGEFDSGVRRLEFGSASENKIGRGGGAHPSLKHIYYILLHE